MNVDDYFSVAGGCRDPVRRAPLGEAWTELSCPTTGASRYTIRVFGPVLAHL